MGHDQFSSSNIGTVAILLLFWRRAYERVSDNSRGVWVITRAARARKCAQMYQLATKCSFSNVAVVQVAFNQ